MPTTAPAPATLLPSDILTVEELAERLKVSSTWVYDKMRQRGPCSLPVLHCGRYLRFSWIAISAWLYQQPQVRRSRKPARRKAAAR